MVKKKVKKNSIKWDSKWYYNYAVRQAQDAEYDLLVLKIVMSKALQREDVEKFITHYLRYLYQQLHGYEYVKLKDIELNKLIREKYR
jgi:hypothetical protein